MKALDACFAQLPRWRQFLCSFWHREARQLLVQSTQTTGDPLPGVADGMRLLRSRLATVLVDARLERIPCVGQRVDPEAMRVVGVIEDPQRDPETVVEEVRPGYRHEGRVIRYAEVRATRRPK